MKIAVWYTGHPIADTIAAAFPYDRFNVGRMNDELLLRYDAHIAYGILRGTADVFRRCDYLGLDWFNVDNGYFGSGHYDGKYRISHRGTQAIYNHPLTLETQPEHTGSHILICPPSAYVCEFFGVDHGKWLEYATKEAEKTGKPYHIRKKDDKMPLDEALKDCFAVITFNSSVGWRALKMGIPCLSDPLHSVVGSYYNTKCIDTLLKMYKYTPTKPLFEFMEKHQFSLNEIRGGKVWHLIEQYMHT